MSFGFENFQIYWMMMAFARKWTRGAERTPSEVEIERGNHRNGRSPFDLF